MLTSAADQPFLAHGAIAAGSPAGYLLTPLIQSRIEATVGHELERTIHLEGANIILSTVGSDGKLVQVAKFTSLFSGSLKPQSTVNVAFDLIPAASLNVGANTEFNANVTVFGTLGGGRVDAEPFDYPVTVCTNCIINNLGTCATAATATNKGNPCNPFQDGVVDCCTDTNGLRCPGPL